MNFQKTIFKIVLKRISENFINNIFKEYFEKKSLWKVTFKDNFLTIVFESLIFVILILF